MFCFSVGQRVYLKHLQGCETITHPDPSSVGPIVGINHQYFNSACWCVPVTYSKV